MPDTEKTEIEIPAEKKGETEFLSKAAFNNPAPIKLKRVLSAVKTCCATAIVMVSGTDLFSGYQAKVIGFCLGLVMLISTGIGLGTGVVADEDKTDK